MDEKILDSINNIVIYKSILKTENVINQYGKIAVSVSGGADSDLVVDLISKCNLSATIKYIFFNTGLEYQATFKQLEQLEIKYNIKIDRIKVKKPIPISINEKGQPFLSKQVSEMITRLQRHNFKWEDESLEILHKRYPNCKSALRWWCNDKCPSLNISQNKYLKDFIISNPPNFKISGYCCKGAKKDPSNDFVKENDVELMITGIRKAEGGARKIAYKTCHNESDDHVNNFLPILWYLNSDKEEYEKTFNIIHSKCYTEYGLKRTGCAGCPFGRNFEHELKVLDKYEPKLFKAACNLFKDSYEYTRSYKEFIKFMNKKLILQMDIDDFL